MKTYKLTHMQNNEIDGNGNKLQKAQIGAKALFMYVTWDNVVIFYSYGTPIAYAKGIDNDHTAAGCGLYLTKTKYSSTTTRHMGDVRWFAAQWLKMETIFTIPQREINDLVRVYGLPVGRGVYEE